MDIKARQKLGDDRSYIKRDKANERAVKEEKHMMRIQGEVWNTQEQKDETNP